MFKKLGILLLCACAYPAYAGNFKVSAERGDRVFISYGSKVQYFRYGIPVDCKYRDSVKGIDNYGMAYDSNGYTCTKDLYIIIKKLADGGQTTIIEVDPRTRERKPFIANYYRNYDTDAW